MGMIFMAREHIGGKSGGKTPPTPPYQIVS